MNRDDLSNKLIHFTKGDSAQAVDNFRSILDSEKLRGGTGFIKGGFKCVCFTESPIGKFSHVLTDPKLFKFPYAPLGVMVDKKWLFERGGRPVIYQPEEEYELLSGDVRWRHKTYDPLKDIDFTWEREWRIKIDELSLDPSQTTIIVPNRQYEEVLIQQHMDFIERAVMAIGDDAVSHVRRYQWHFICLEDLGVKVNWGR